MVNWVVYQNGNEFEINDVLYTGVQNPPTPLLYSISMYCPYGRSEPGIIQLFAGFDAELSIAEDLNTIEVGIVPNPSNGLFQLNVPSKEGYQIELVDVKGSLIWQDQLTGSTSYPLDISTSPEGVYLLRVSSSSGIGHSRIIKY